MLFYILTQNIMMIGDINIVAVIAATLWSFFVGFLWYGVLFSKAWQKATGISWDDTSGMGKMMMQNQAFNLVWIAVLYYILSMSGIADLSEMLKAVVLFWGAFCVPSIMAGIIWERRPLALGMINTWAFLAQSLVAAAILSHWL